MRAGAKKSVPRKLTQEECDEIYKFCCSPRFKDSNPHEIYHILLDEGVYLASESSFYRILRKKKAITHRSDTKEGISDDLRQTLGLHQDAYLRLPAFP